MIGLALGGAVVLARGRFSQVPSLPPRPPMPQVSGAGTAEQLLNDTLTSPAVWRNFLQTDARAAGVTAPTVAELGKPFTYQREASSHVLSFGAPTWTAAGLTLTLESGDRNSAVLSIHNPGTSDVAYRVVSRPSLGSSVCNVSAPLVINALVIARGGTVRRTECAVRAGLELTILSVETIALPPLSSWYVRQVSPLAVGLEPRWARAHRPEMQANCSSIVPQAVRGALQKGDLTWRDLVDFYARHRCETYQFPITYRAITKEGERELPALPPPPGERRN